MRQELNKFKKKLRENKKKEIFKPCYFPCLFWSIIHFILNSLTAFFIFVQGQCDNHSLTAVKLQFLILTLFMSDRPLTPTECTYDICAYPALQITRSTEEKPQHFFCLSVTLSCSILLCIAETSDEWLGSCSFNVSSASVIQVSRTSRFLAKVW